MASDRRLLNLCIIFYILSIWYNTVVNSNPEWDNLDELPEFSTDELELYGIEFQDEDSDALKELFQKIDSQQLTDEASLQYMQVSVAKLLQKWHIDANVDNLTLITRRFIDDPRKMTSELMIMILGKETLQNMTTEKRNKKYTTIPENVKNFVLEYVNSQTESGIDNSTFLKTLQVLCSRLRFINKRRSRNRVTGELPEFSTDELELYGIEFQDTDSDALKELFEKNDSQQLTDEGSLQYMQAKLLQKWHIDANVDNLTLITRRFIDNPKKMTSELMIMILGKEMLQNMTPSKRNKTKYTTIPENVKNFVLEYVNSQAEVGIDNSTFLYTLQTLCNYLRFNNERMLSRKRVTPNISESATTETPSPLQAKLLQKWHIHANVDNLTLITRRFIDDPRKMTSKLMIMILGEEMLQNMTTTIKGNEKYPNIPDNVQNFVLEYVNSQAKPSIDNSTFLKTLQVLCSKVRFINKRRSRNRDSTMSAAKETPSPLQVELLLQKFQIHVDINDLNAIANKFRYNYKYIMNPLLKMITGERNLRNMCTRNNLKGINIPTNVLNFVYEYANLYTKPKIDKKKFDKKVSDFCSKLRRKYSTSNDLVE